MGLFSFNKKKKATKFRITEPDRNWVEDNFKWLIEVYGYPDRQNQQIIISNKYFPKTFSVSNLKVENLIEDLCYLLSLNANKIKFELHEDLRDSYETPYVSEEKPFEAEVEILEGNNYKIHIAKSILNHHNRLIFNLIYEFIKIRLTEDKLQYDSGEDTSLFLFIAGIYFDFGVLLSQNLTDKGQINDAFWVTKWNYISEMPNEIMAFALAIYSKLTAQENPEWKNELPQEFRKLFDNAISYLKTNPSTILSTAELDASNLFRQAEQDYQNNNYNSAISYLEKALVLTKNKILKADIYNNIGYYQLRKGDYKKSIPNFKKALQIDSNYGFAYDNLGHALILIGELEEGKQELEKALKTENNDNAYTYRNLALYHLAKHEIETADSYFQLAFKSETNPVDLLELHYANFLFKQNEKEKGMQYLNIAVKKGEPEAIKRMSEINKNE